MSPRSTASPKTRISGSSTQAAATAKNCQPIRTAACAIRAGHSTVARSSISRAIVVTPRSSKPPLTAAEPSRFNAFALDDQLAGGFDVTESSFRAESGSPLAVAQPFQITSFSFGNKSIPVVRGGNVESAPLMVITLGHALRPAEVWLGGHSMCADAAYECAQRCADQRAAAHAARRDQLREF